MYTVIKKFNIENGYDNKKEKQHYWGYFSLYNFRINHRI